MPNLFYVAQHESTGEYVSGLNSNGLPIFDADLNNAEWSYSELTVQTFINRYNIENVKPKSEGGNHPPKPPLSA